ncbi:MAG TPA: hypothetical protein VJ763_03335 [Sphingomicrobium sp.]|nr:hypothetical protein [Sphingomicrobium sp.]
MTAPPSPAADLASRAKWIARAGWLILLLSAGSAFLPLVSRANGEVIIGTLLIAAGLVEIFAGLFRHETPKLAMLAGAITTFAGFLFATEERTGFLSTLTIIAGWLYLRSAILALAAMLERGSVRNWTALSATMDLLLAFALTVGLSIAAIVVNFFGATPVLIASFAWVLALSFVVNGLMLLEVASVARRDEDV